MSTSQDLPRRNFMKTAAGVTAAGLSILPSRAGRAAANERVNVAVIGINSMGRNHIQGYGNLANAQVTALCDIDENLFAERVKVHFTEKKLPEPMLYTDIRELLENKDIDAISIATPNHWHTLAAIWGLQAGKHVSVEKPCCQNFWEGQQLVKAAKKYGLVVQDGAEQRSNPCAQSMATFLHEGGLGEVYLAKGTCFKWRNTIGKTPDGPVPAGVHYDLWQGPAPARPFSENRFHYNWHWNWDYGNGDMGNQGVHEMDIARWGLGVTLPTRVCAMGGHYMFDDDQNTPNTLTALFEFPNPSGKGDKKKMLQFDVRHWSVADEIAIPREDKSARDYVANTGNSVGNAFYGDRGFVLKDVNNWKSYLGPKRESGASGSGLGDHYANFIEAIQANDITKLNGSIEDGFHTCALIHLANISYRLGRSLDFDPETQRILGDDEANALLRREYREPFVVPEIS